MHYDTDGGDAQINLATAWQFVLFEAVRQQR